MPIALEPRPTVQLLHELPDGSRHVDWLLARDPAGEEPLISFRLAARVDELPPGGRLEAERIADHRPRYLDYEGPVAPAEPGGPARGHVRRLRRGRIVDWREAPGVPWDLRIEWEAAGEPQRLRLETDGRRWGVLAVS